MEDSPDEIMGNKSPPIPLVHGVNHRRATRPTPIDKDFIDWSDVKLPKAYCQNCRRKFCSQQTLLQHYRDSWRHKGSAEADRANRKLAAYSKHRDEGQAFCCLCWLSFPTAEELLVHLAESVVHSGSDLQHQAGKRLDMLRTQQQSQAAVLRWLGEAQHVMKGVNRNLRVMQSTINSLSLPIPHTEFDAAISSIRPLHQLFQLLLDLPPEGLARHAARLYSSDNPLHLLGAHFGARPLSSSMPAGLVGQCKKRRKQTSMQKLNVVAWYANDIARDISRLLQAHDGRAAES